MKKILYTLGMLSLFMFTVTVSVLGTYTFFNMLLHDVQFLNTWCIIVVAIIGFSILLNIGDD